MNMIVACDGDAWTRSAQHRLAAAREKAASVWSTGGVSEAHHLVASIASRPPSFLSFGCGAPVYLLQNRSDGRYMVMETTCGRMACVVHRPLQAFAYATKAVAHLGPQMHRVRATEREWGAIRKSLSRVGVQGIRVPRGDGVDVYTHPREGGGPVLTRPAVAIVASVLAMPEHRRIGTLGKWSMADNRKGTRRWVNKGSISLPAGMARDVAVGQDMHVEDLDLGCAVEEAFILGVNENMHRWKELVGFRPRKDVST
jgi:hypothetical protein